MKTKALNFDGRREIENEMEERNEENWRIRGNHACSYALLLFIAYFLNPVQKNMYVCVCIFTAAAAASKPATEVAPSNRFASRAKDAVLPAATSMDTKSLPRFRIPDGSTA